MEIPKPTPLETVITAGLNPGMSPPAMSDHRSGWAQHPGIGLYIYHDDQIHFSIRCGQIGQGGVGGHAHNDQLSFTFHQR